LTFPTVNNNLIKILTGKVEKDEGCRGMEKAEV